ncbi:glycosyltransferase family 9 protein [Desulfacinum hydrothermale]|uniref:glycosyltransferase family 9 protein n=1 Tax=Desulfacinum hydrothermale TaxID=109258 RepID=UPI001483A68B|nr:glycosyltransferase family 9 protein [Desulfacinum hydrothermale]
MGFLHQGALGDFVLFVPILDALYGQRGVECFDLWTRPGYRALLEGKPYAVQIHGLEAPFWDALYRDDAWEEVPIPEDLLRPEAFFWVGQPGARPWVQRLGERLPIPVHWVQSFPAKEDGKGPVTRFVADQLGSLGWPVDPDPPQVVPLGSARETVERWLVARGLGPGGYGLVHVGSGGRAKVWPLARWQRLLRYMDETLPVPLVFLTGPADDAYVPFVDHMARRFGGHRVSGWDLDQVAALLSLAGFFVGCDSGVSHLAAAVGTCSLVIFGPTDPRVWAPRGPNVHVFQDHWTPEEVLNWDLRDPGAAIHTVSDVCHRFFQCMVGAFH